MILVPLPSPRAVALALLMAPAPAFAAILDALPTPLTWIVLAAIGLLAVVVGAVITVRRGRRDEAPRAADHSHDLRTPAPSKHLIADLPVPDRPGATTPPLDAVAPLPAAIRRRAPSADVSPIPIDTAREAAAESPPTPDAAEAPISKEEPLQQAFAAPVPPEPVPDAEVPPGAVVRPQEPLAETQAHEEASHLFLALHHVDLSIDVLRRHLAADARPMPAVWVMLLDLCRTHGRETAFREIATEFHARFNVATPSWDHYPPPRDEPGLEAYPRIVKDLTLCWGTHECRRLLDRLLFDNRQGGRRGFTMNAYNDLVALRRAADVVLDAIEQDFAEEAKVRDAYAQAASDEGGSEDHPAVAHPSPLIRDLETELDTDLRDCDDARSALECEHPALADALTREWRGAALAGRLAEMLARAGELSPPLSSEAREDVALLHEMAERLAAGRRRPTVAAD